MDAKIPTAGLLIIGNEILSGQTQDINIQFLSQNLGDLGIIVKEIRIVGDMKDQIADALNAMRPLYTYVFTTGGIGPTHDDITSIAVAHAFKKSIVRDPKALEMIYSQVPQRHPHDPRSRMADLPEGSLLLENSISQAPGFKIDNVFVLAGVPPIMQAMFKKLIPDLEKGQPLLKKAFVFLAFESRIADDLRQIQTQFPQVEIGSYPNWPSTQERGVKVIFKGYDLHAMAEVEKALLDRALEHHIKIEELTL